MSRQTLPYLPKRLALISLFLFTTLTASYAQTLYPSEDVPQTKGSVVIELKKAYVSGICILKREADTIHGGIFNEFGISVMSFSYNEVTGKVKLQSVISLMDKWYIRRVLKKDIANWMRQLRAGNTDYVNERRHIIYKLQPLENQENDTEE